MEIIKTLVVKTKKNKYTFDLTKNTYSFWYEHAHAETKGQFYVYEFSDKDKDGVKVVHENTDYVNFYINNIKSFSFVKNSYHDFQPLELSYRNVAITDKYKKSLLRIPFDMFTIFKADNFSINLANELTFVRVENFERAKENNFYPNAFISFGACDFGVAGDSGRLYNVTDIARLIVEGCDFVYKDKEGYWLLTLSDNGKGLISRYKFAKGN